MELIRKNIHMNRQKGKALSQITLENDYNIPERMPDVSMVIQEKGEAEITEIKAEAGRVRLKGSLQVQVLYMEETPEQALHSIRTQLPFEETMNVEEACEGDSLKVKWTLEDLSAVLINSRKLSLKAILSLEAAIEELFDEEIPVSAEGGSGLQQKTCQFAIAGLSAQKKDTCRIKDEILLPANKPNIREVIWQDVCLQGTELRLSEGEILLKGELAVFVLYEGEEEPEKACWLEQILPFNSQVQVPGCQEGMLSDIGVWLAHSDLEVKPDYDGELRLLNLEAVLELDIQIYEEQQVSMLCDLYDPGQEIKLTTMPAVYEKLLICNTSKCRVSERMKTGNRDLKILQLCYSRGEIKVDECRVTEKGLQIEGVVSVRVLYITSDDAHPFLGLKGVVPFTHLIEVPGISSNSVYYLQTALEQLSVSMVSSEELEVKAVVSLGALVLERVEMERIEGIREEPLDWESMKALPGFLVYVVQPGDNLWDLAKTYHSTVEQISLLNELNTDSIKPGQKLVLAKELERITLALK